jgi:LysR family transcriptional regulator, benzoate and cis,cis-muconate-responsive activator of ben and cat genes
MTITQLENFIIVSETLNFRKAADAIYIAQPALTRQIQQLEEEIGAKLFDRSKKQIKLTVAGAAFKLEIKRILEQLKESVKKAALIEKGEAGEIKIGHSSSAMNSIIPGLLSYLNINYPLLKAILLEGHNKFIFNGLINNEFDFGFVPNAEVPREIDFLEVYKENYVLILPENHQLSADTFKGLSDLNDENWILHPRFVGSGYMDEILRVLRIEGVVPKIAHESPNTSTVLRLVEAGLGISMMGKSTLIGYDIKIKSIELVNLQEKLNMKFVWKKERSKELAPYLKVIKDHLIKPRS